MDANEAIVRKFIDEAFNQGRLESIDELLSPDFVEHQRFGPTSDRGRQVPKQIVNTLRRAFSDFHLAVEPGAGST